jgi:putative membrane protein
MFPGNFWSSGMWIFPILMPIIMIVVLAIIILIVRPMMSGCGGPRFPWQGSNQEHHEVRDSESETPLEILKKRYARGEITKEEYEDMKGDL